VVTLVKKFEGYAKLDHISAEIKKELDDFLASIHEVPNAPWDEGVCKVCGVDKDDNSVLLCDTCDAEYHTYCLNPPLARIPEGNWYCPSCVVSKHVVQEASGISQVIGIVHCKKYQGEITHVYLEKLSHLSVTMKEKEYWEFSVDEVCAWT
jgi:rubredoxin